MLTFSSKLNLICFPLTMECLDEIVRCTNLATTIAVLESHRIYGFTIIVSPKAHHKCHEPKALYLLGLKKYILWHCRKFFSTSESGYPAKILRHCCKTFSEFVWSGLRRSLLECTSACRQTRLGPRWPALGSTVGQHLALGSMVDYQLALGP